MKLYNKKWAPRFLHERRLLVLINMEMKIIRLASWHLKYDNNISILQMFLKALVLHHHKRPQEEEEQQQQHSPSRRRIDFQENDDTFIEGLSISLENTADRRKKSNEQRKYWHKKLKISKGDKHERYIDSYYHVIKIHRYHPTILDNPTLLEWVQRWIYVSWISLATLHLVMASGNLQKGFLRTNITDKQNAVLSTKAHLNHLLTCKDISLECAKDIKYPFVLISGFEIKLFLLHLAALGFYILESVGHGFFPTTIKEVKDGSFEKVICLLDCFKDMCLEIKAFQKEKTDTHQANQRKPMDDFTNNTNRRRKYKSISPSIITHFILFGPSLPNDWLF
ncbi:hypothetical protein BDA99DRAFT_573927 [Phascolomyces articulosus]|uniref:Uncharacterized protein n=1 Tax=Phascolomyces articulosus TaxID=60185 RepID=A0AAD5PD62_9FUNG|nr:hypothetical protein BDA99DRAFT_573927 [Phascolomyces articulosus]